MLRLFYPVIYIYEE